MLTKKTKARFYAIFVIITLQLQLFQLNLTIAQESKYNLSLLGDEPNWEELNQYQNSITRSEFEMLLNQVYAPNGSAPKNFEIQDDKVKILTSSKSIKQNPNQNFFTLKFNNNPLKQKKINRYWHTPAELPPAKPEKPLSDLKIAIDPGHIGGEFAEMEARYFKIGNAKPVKEAEMVLLVAKKIKIILEKYGAKVYLVRNKNKPVTKKRPEDFTQTAKKHLQKRTTKPNPETIQKLANLLFYLISEIKSRAKIINEKIRPDLTLCLHFNAEEWGDPVDNNKFVFSKNNHLHFLINGSYSKGEINYDNQRWNLTKRILQRTYYYENALSETIAIKFAEYSKLEPYTYNKNIAKRISPNPYIWARNLLANRIYHNPVVYCEPYVMNNENVHARIQAGDYSGRKKIEGYDEPRLNIFNEYALAVTAGLVNYYKKNRRLQ